MASPHQELLHRLRLAKEEYNAVMASGASISDQKDAEDKVLGLMLVALDHIEPLLPPPPSPCIGGLAALLPE